MKDPDRTRLLLVTVLSWGLAGGCSAGNPALARRSLELRAVPSTHRFPEPTAPASLAQATCWSTMSCCIQRNPFTFVERCGADPLEAASILPALELVSKERQSAPATLATQHGEEAAEAAGTTEDDFAHNAELPEWKQECIRNYVACQTEPDWQGPCYACLRRCEGQQQWPFKMCSPPGE